MQTSTFIFLCTPTPPLAAISRSRHKKKNPVVFSFLETHKHTPPNKNETSPHQLSPFSDLKEHLLIGKRALFKNTTYATHTRAYTHRSSMHKNSGMYQQWWTFKKKRRRHAETRGGEKGEEFCGKPKQPTRMLAGLYLFAFYYNVLSLWRTGFEILTDFIRLNTIAAKQTGIVFSERSWVRAEQGSGRY